MFEMMATARSDVFSQYSALFQAGNFDAIE